MFEFRIMLEGQLYLRTIVNKGEIFVGRGAQNDVVLQDKRVSRLHFVIRPCAAHFVIEDRSANGLKLNGEAVLEVLELPVSCEISVFPFVIHLDYHGEDQTMPIPIMALKGLESTELTTPFEKNTPATEVLGYHFETLLGESPAMQKLYQAIRDIAPSRATVLLRGEQGTGKELVAKAIHQSSTRSKKKMLTLNCAALPIALFESELFGYEKGAFTGASSSQKGKVEVASGGTLFFDEIGELSMDGQAKLLRFLQDQSFMPLGSGRERKADVRIVAATNANLEAAISKGRFRSDLYYRLKVVELELPPLRERPEDIPLLCAHFLSRFEEELQLNPAPTLSDETLQDFQTRQWVGNIRELENRLYSAVLRAQPPYRLAPEHFPRDVENPVSHASDAALPFDALSKKLLLQTLEAQGWDTIKAAAILNVSRGTIYYRLKKYGISPKQSS